MQEERIQSFRQIERLMQEVPNFSCRGTGIFICTEIEDNRLRQQIEEGKMTYVDIILETMRPVTYLPFLVRLNKFLKGCEEGNMYYKNDTHRTVFGEVVERLDIKNNRLMSALYLLTAEENLWNQAKHYVSKNKVNFDEMKLKNSTDNGYTFYGAAKDLYLGTKSLTIADLADTKLISTTIFGIICNAMAIRRFGLGAIHEKEKGGNRP